MDQWLGEVGYTSPDNVQKYIKDANWQRFRISMKGKATEVKLDMLKEYWDENGGDLSEATRVRVWNYLKALRRGGQLNEWYQAVK